VQGIEFGWRAPTFSVKGESATKLMEETTNYLRKTHEIFDAVWMDDHFHPWLKSMLNTTPVLECWTTLTYLSATFTDLDYSAIVLCNSYRNPAYLAKSAATLSCLTGGRFVLGIGAGWKEDEYLANGYTFPSAKERIERLEESVRIIREMWTNSPASFAGKYHSVKDAYCLPRPMKKPPIMIGGKGEVLMLGVIARQADWWYLGGVSPDTFE
jgi:alkanesulfonate monooxygenase SsuD/methylene tetrahydromethanopterin reductase-like flavin-dependent oxidoreductase (luciferase family)